MDGRKHALRLFPAETPGSRDENRSPWRRRRTTACRCRASSDGGVQRTSAGVWMEWASGVPMLAALRPWNLWELPRSARGRAGGAAPLVTPEGLREGAPGLLARTRWRRTSGPGAAAGGAGIRTDTLVHHDFHPLNLLVGSQGITGIIDWASAAAGDPRADIALTISILRCGSDSARPFVAEAGRNPALRACMAPGV